MAFQETKIDSVLGKKVNQHLLGLGIQTPQVANVLSDDAQISRIEDAFTDIMTTLGLDLTNNSLIDTPARFAKMYVQELFWGLKPDNFPKCTTVENGSDGLKYDQMIVEGGITTISHCEHHFVVIDGHTSIAYIPKNKVLGLSKMPRIVEYFGRRPQIQERITQQVGETLKFILETDDVAVYMNAEHYCVKSRGVEDRTAYTKTSFLSGAFKDDPATRAEFYALVK